MLRGFNYFKNKNLIQGGRTIEFQLDFFGNLHHSENHHHPGFLRFVVRYHSGFLVPSIIPVFLVTVPVASWFPGCSTLDNLVSFASTIEAGDIRDFSILASSVSSSLPISLSSTSSSLSSS